MIVKNSKRRVLTSQGAVNIKTIGDIGENLVMNILSQDGNLVVLSENYFDSVKDMTHNGLTVEVKTLVPIKKYDAFCLPRSQWKKCDSVDRLIFVEISGGPIRVFESLKPRKSFSEYFNFDYCRFYTIEDLKLIATIDDDDLVEKMLELSPSKYITRRKN